MAEVYSFLIPMNADTPEELIQAIDLALCQGNFHQAKTLSNQASQDYPNHDKIQRYARILSSPDVPFYQLSRKPDTPLNLNWVIRHREHYRGRWVALEKGHLIADASSLDELFAQVGKEKMKDLFYHSGGGGVLLHRESLNVLCEKIHHKNTMLVKINK